MTCQTHGKCNVCQVSLDSPKFSYVTKCSSKPPTCSPIPLPWDKKPCNLVVMSEGGVSYLNTRAKLMQNWGYLCSVLLDFTNNPNELPFFMAIPWRMAFFFFSISFHCNTTVLFPTCQFWPTYTIFWTGQWIPYDSAETGRLDQKELQRTSCEEENPRGVSAEGVATWMRHHSAQFNSGGLSLSHSSESLTHAQQPAFPPRLRNAWHERGWCFSFTFIAPRRQLLVSSLALS
jgi:hypothetical protein